MGTLSFAYLILVLNPIQMLSLLIYPLAPRAARRVNRWCARSIWGLWVLMAEHVLGCEIQVKGDPLPWRENALVLPNHQSMADVLVLLCVAWRCGRLGDMKWFVKDPIKYVPGPGWGMWLLDCIFLKRDWTRDKAGILRLFAKYKTHGIPIFLVSFLEGTRKNKHNHAQAQAYARERGHPVPAHTLIPRTKGFVATMIGLRSHLDAVYDVTIGYPGEVPSLGQAFGSRMRRVDIHVRRFPIESFPEDEEGLSDWVFERFTAKDQLLAEFQAQGTFPGEDLYPKPRLEDWFRPEDRPPASQESGARLED